MLVHSATCGVLAVSGITILACMFAVAVIYGQVQSIWLELDIEMDQFKLEADDLWRDMLKMGAGLASNRQRRQSVYGGYGAVGTNKEPPPPITKTLVSNPLHVSAPACNCDKEKRCPVGKPGKTGEPGPKGLDGVPGIDGVDGEAAPDVVNQPPRGCFHCPKGAPGPPGPAGRPGVRGRRGDKGSHGFPGRDGLDAPQGEMGPIGPPGEDGKVGKAGSNGVDGEKPIGRRGPPGPIGAEGPQGERAGPPGPVGEPGIKGMVGLTGSAGTPGEEGAVGPRGQIGRDAEYCPCPARGENQRSDGSRGGASSDVSSSRATTDNYRRRIVF